MMTLLMNSYYSHITDLRIIYVIHYYYVGTGPVPLLVSDSTNTDGGNPRRLSGPIVVRILLIYPNHIEYP